MINTIIPEISRSVKTRGEGRALTATNIEGLETAARMGANEGF
jgi:hypothetical protein